MKKLIFLIALTILSAAYISGVLVADSYQDKVYDSDMAKYNAEKAEFDSIQNEKAKIVYNEAFNRWLATNDTSIRKVKKIKRVPQYGELGYYKKLDKWRCTKESYSDDLICEKMTKWVTTDYYVSGYSYDTTWTDGYKNRESVLEAANKFASEMEKTSKVEYKKYDGHEFHFLIKRDDWMIWLIFMILLLSSPIIVMNLIKAIVEVVQERKEAKINEEIRKLQLKEAFEIYDEMSTEEKEIAEDEVQSILSSK